MSYFMSTNATAQEPFSPAVFPLRKEALWRRETAPIDADVVSISGSPALFEPRGIEIWEQSGASVVRIWDCEVQRLEQLYVFRKRIEVLQFLKMNRFLAPLLLEAYTKIGRHFGQYPRVFLEVIADPEANNNSQLFAFIGTSLSPDEALEMLDRLDEEWWLDTLDEAQGKLCIDLEFL